MFVGFIHKFKAVRPIGKVMRMFGNICAIDCLNIWEKNGVGRDKDEQTGPQDFRPQVPFFVNRMLLCQEIGAYSYNVWRKMGTPKDGAFVGENPKEGLSE